MKASFWKHYVLSLSLTYYGPQWMTFNKTEDTLDFPLALSQCKTCSINTDYSIQNNIQF